MYESNAGLVKPAEVYSELYENDNLLTFELSDKVSGVNGYYSADTGWMEFENNTINVSESSGVLSFTINRSGGVENHLSAIMIAHDGTAVDQIDFEAFVPLIIVIDDGVEERTININILDNNIEDGTRSFTVSLSEVTLGDGNRFSIVNTDRSLLTVNILDDESDLIFADGFE